MLATLSRRGRGKKRSLHRVVSDCIVRLFHRYRYIVKFKEFKPESRGLDPGIHLPSQDRSWSTGSSLAMTPKPTPGCADSYLGCSHFGRKE
jgi:hypothetical protein